MVPACEKSAREKDNVQLHEFMDLFQKIGVCRDVVVNVNDTESQLEADNDGGYDTITDKEIIMFCSSKDAEKKNSENR